MTNPAPYEIYDMEEADAATEAEPTPKSEQNPLPPPILPDISEDTLKRLSTWVREWLHDLRGAHDTKVAQWAEEEKAYRARYEGDFTFPFVGASGITVPLVAMAVDPVYARLETGIFKGDRVFVLKPLKTSVTDDLPNVEKWLHHVQKHKMQLRRHLSPRFLENAIHGTMVLKSCYEYEDREIKQYDSEYKVVTGRVQTAGAQIYGVGLKDFMFPPRYQHVQDCPIVFERIKTTPGKLWAAQESGRLTNVEKVVDQAGRPELDELEVERENSSNHRDSGLARNELIIWEIWCDFDINGDKKEERLVLTYEEHTNTFLQIRLNWYFHQLKPYVVIPYSRALDTLYGIGLAEMLHVFQIMLTKWERMAENNAYLANTRMFLGKEGVISEDTLRVYAARVIKCSDPGSDLVPLPVADLYQSTLMERQNIMGLAEKRSGISDYLTGRESPIIGSRATATSTVALIQEGTKRVEQVLENHRQGMSEAMMMTFSNWAQFGIDPATDIAFGDDEVAQSVHRFFNTIGKENIDGAIAIDLAVVDASNNKQIQQQGKLALIQVMMQYLQKVVELGGQAMQMGQGNPQYVEMAVEVLRAAKQMFKDYINTTDATDPEAYLPDVERFLSQPLAGAGGGVQPGAAGPGGQSGVLDIQSALAGASRRPRAGPSIGGGPAQAV